MATDPAPVMCPSPSITIHEPPRSLSSDCLTAPGNQKLSGCLILIVISRLDKINSLRFDLFVFFFVFLGTNVRKGQAGC